MVLHENCFISRFQLIVGMKHQKADSKIYVCQISKSVSSKLYDIENSKS